MASYCGSPSKLHTATNDFLSHFTENPNTLLWPSDHLGPARTWPLQPAPFSRPTCLASLLSCTHSCTGLAPTSPPQRRAFHDHGIYNTSLPRPYFSSWHLLATQTISFSSPIFPLATVLRGKAPYLSSLLQVPRTALDMIRSFIGQETEYSHTLSPSPSLTSTHTHPPRVPGNSQ